MTLTDKQVEACRMQFPALSREVNGQAAVFLDGPAGTQVPQRVIDAISRYLSHHNANHGGLFATSEESDKMLDETHRAVADFLGAENPDCVTFGPNMTTLTFAISRSLAKTWSRGDEIIVSRLEHDANFSPWVLAAEDAGATIRYVDVKTEDCTLDLDQFRSLINANTRLVAVGGASNAVGTVNPIEKICRWAHEAGALTFIDAVHYAPHLLIDVNKIGCDFLACSAYKFFGPHIGILWGRQDLLEQLSPYKLRPAPDDLPGRWMTGTQNHECLAGTLAAVDYLADLGRTVSRNDSLTRREALVNTFQAIGQYEQELVARLLAGMAEQKNFRVWGITDLDRLSQRTPTISITHLKIKPDELAKQLARRGIFSWHGNYYALPLTEALALEPEGMVRLGLVHYNTRNEVERLLAVLREIDDAA